MVVLFFLHFRARRQHLGIDTFVIAALTESGIASALECREDSVTSNSFCRAKPDAVSAAAYLIGIVMCTAVAVGTPISQSALCCTL